MAKWYRVNEKNFRVEVGWSSRFRHVSLDKQDAQDLARYVNQLRDLETLVVWDNQYECMYCHGKANSLAMLEGCCNEAVEAIEKEKLCNK